MADDCIRRTDLKGRQKVMQTKSSLLAPIVVFAYNRADKLERLLHSLEKNTNTKKMDLYIFVDVPDKKNRKDAAYNQEVIEFLKKYKELSQDFQSIQIEVADRHKGLAKSIISGVTKIINEYGKVIVLEDDLEVSDDFLDYMQRGLSFYRSDRRVWSLGGYTPEIEFPSSYKKDVYLLPRVESWGWGTWIDRWNRTDWAAASYKKFKNNLLARILFNIGGSDLSLMLDYQMADKNFNSWAIRWCFQEFVERKYTVYPRESRVINCGDDSRSTHGAFCSTQKLKGHYRKCHLDVVDPDIRIIWRMKRHYDISLKEKMVNLLKKVF